MRFVFPAHCWSHAERLFTRVNLNKWWLLQKGICLWESSFRLYTCEGSSVFVNVLISRGDHSETCLQPEVMFVSDHLGTLEIDLTFPAGLCLWLFYRSKVWGKHFWWGALFVWSSERRHPPAAEGVQTDHSQVHEEGLLWCLPAAVRTWGMCRASRQPSWALCSAALKGNSLVPSLIPGHVELLKGCPLFPRGWSPGVCVHSL